MDKASGVDKPLVPVRAWVWMGAFHDLCAMRKKKTTLSPLQLMGAAG